MEWFDGGKCCMCIFGKMEGLMLMVVLELKMVGEEIRCVD